MTPGRTLLAAACCAALAGAIAWGSQVPFRVESTDDAAIRLSWRAVSQPVEACHTPTPEEQARLPVHMRQSRICERRLAAFRLTVALDGRPAIDEAIAPEGAQRDRPAYVLRELRVAPGSHRLAVRFAPESEAVGPPLVLEAELELAPRQVALVTENAQGGLEVRHNPRTH